MGREDFERGWDDHECPDAEFIEDNLPEWLNTSNSSALRSFSSRHSPRAYLREPHLNFSSGLEEDGKESFGDVLMGALFKMMYGLFLAGLIMFGGWILIFIISCFLP